DTIRKFENGRSFRVFIYSAYNAMGLIGSEYNGIAILDEDNKCVVADRIANDYNGRAIPTKAQLDKLNEILSPDYKFADFKKLVNGCERARVTL
ncbi:hypothetical protein LC612_28355, partial [Nostoc sp. CHAB 5834]|nr:hypothetical protein [Nostoc sp. CHAB 5834]